MAGFPDINFATVTNKTIPLELRRNAGSLDAYERAHFPVSLRLLYLEVKDSCGSPRSLWGISIAKTQLTFLVELLKGYKTISQNTRNGSVGYAKINVGGSG